MSSRRAAVRRARPPGSVDRRLAGCVGASLLVHALLALDWGFDSGRRPAQAPSVITARLDLSLPASPPDPGPDGEQPAAAPGLLVVEVPAVLTLAEGKSSPAETGGDAVASAGNVPLPAGRPPVRSSPDPSPSPSGGLPDAKVAVAPLPAAQVAVEPGPVLTVPVAPERPRAATPQAGDPSSGAADLTWYTGRDLDVLPRPLAPVEPQFPLNAQLRGVSGKVTLAIAIDAAGRVVDIEVVRADPAGFFEGSALDAFRAARYAPGIKDGRAVRARLQTVVVFELGP